MSIGKKEEFTATGGSWNQYVERRYDRKPSVIAQKFKFNTRVQNLTGHCDYGDFRNHRLRDRLVVCVRNAHIQQCLLADSNLNLETAYDTAVALEAAENNVTLLQCVKPTMTSESVDSSSQVNRLQQLSKRTQFKCYRCGGRHTHPKDFRYTQTV
ncbi:hypothetical protein X801_05636 [Opisthorchis viverrini]|uniref:Uncharacterized protein n=1 Tax=Opisthorchis viverrini TaxID=6198 RepID=A0A1S8WVG8_OPIVI|nr:hypothetical protein X801_05636 [Opisthorchis viverrini]